MHAPTLTCELDTVHSDAAEEFGKKVGGLLGHDFTGGGDFDDFFHVASVEEERELRFSGIHSGDGVCGFALVGEIGFLSDGLWRDAERGFENAFMKKDRSEEHTSELQS